MKTIENLTSHLRKIIFGKVRWYDYLLVSGRIDKNSYYDSLTELIIAKTLTTKSLCVDVGCHVGSILSVMMKHAPKGTFYAFEPIPGLYQRLEENFNFPNVHLYNIALSNSAGIASFNFVKSNPGYSGLQKRKYDRPDEVDEQINVPTELLDNILADASAPISLIKIDVEGAEFLVMQGGRKKIAQDKPVIIFEHGLGGADFYGKGPDDVYGLLCGECGLHISLISDWLLRKRPLNQMEFRDQFYKGRNYFFIAHP
ncbi:MAG: FkbM family methyltransferase [Bacteroidetes bacterium]|nr:FkbM family methyltransferase [Bacteroidota bacterium]